MLIGSRYWILNIYAKGKIPTKTDHPLQICFAPFLNSPEHGWTKAIPLCLDHSNIFWIRENTYFKKGGYVYWSETFKSTGCLLICIINDAFNWTIRLSYEAAKGKPLVLLWSLITEQTAHKSLVIWTIVGDRSYWYVNQLFIRWLRNKSTSATATRFVAKLFCS